MWSGGSNPQKLCIRQHSPALGSRYFFSWCVCAVRLSISLSESINFFAIHPAIHTASQPASHNHTHTYISVAQLVEIRRTFLSFTATGFAFGAHHQPPGFPQLNVVYDIFICKKLPNSCMRSSCTDRFLAHLSPSSSFLSISLSSVNFETKGTFFFFFCGFDVCWLIKRKQNSFEELATRLGFWVGGNRLE